MLITNVNGAEIDCPKAEATNQIDSGKGEKHQHDNLYGIKPLKVWANMVDNKLIQAHK